MSACLLPVPPEESTTLSRSPKIMPALAFAAALTAALPASAEENNIDIRQSEKMADIRAFLEKEALPKSTASARAELERSVFLAHNVFADPLVAESLKEFEELDEEAADLGVAPPAPDVREAARRILNGLLREFPRYYAVSPGEGREVAIQASAGMGKGRGVLIVCDDKDISCYVTMNGKSRRAHYDLESAENLPDSFIRDAMRELG